MKSKIKQNLARRGKKKPLSKKAFNKIDDAYFARTGRHKPGRKGATKTHDKTGEPISRTYG